MSSPLPLYAQPTACTRNIHPPSKLASRPSSLAVTRTHHKRSEQRHRLYDACDGSSHNLHGSKRNTDSLCLSVSLSRARVRTLPSPTSSQPRWPSATVSLSLARAREREHAHMFTFVCILFACMLLLKCIVYVIVSHHRSVCSPPRLSFLPVSFPVASRPSPPPSSSSPCFIHQLIQSAERDPNIAS